jgi:hypothetical protein
MLQRHRLTLDMTDLREYLPCSTNWICSMSSSPDTVLKPETTPTEVEAHGMLAREAGVPFRLAGNIDAGVNPIAEWLSLMAVVQMLCPVWPVRDQPMQGDHWLLQ